MMNAYNELYLDDAMNNLGDMVEYAVCDMGYNPDQFFGWFISSGIAAKFEKRGDLLSNSYSDSVWSSFLVL